MGLAELVGRTAAAAVELVAVDKNMAEVVETDLQEQISHLH